VHMFSPLPPFPGFLGAALLIPLVAVAGFWTLVILALVFWHRERMARLQQPAPTVPVPSPNYALRRVKAPVESACRLMGVGFGLFAGLITLGWGPWLLGGIIPFLIGAYRLALIGFGVEAPGFPSRPVSEWVRDGARLVGIGLLVILVVLWLGWGPWILGGTIPLGMGLGNFGVRAWWGAFPPPQT